MSTKTRMQRITLSLATAAVVCIASGYAAVASSTHFRTPTVVVTFDIEKVSADLTERADSEARLRKLFSKIEEELLKRNDAIKTLQESLQSAAEADQEAIIEQLNQLALEAMSYQQFAEKRVDNERSLMFRDLYMKIRNSVADIAKENGYDLVLITDDEREIMVNPKSSSPQEFQVREQIGQQRIVYASSQIDITEQVVTHMNLEWEKRSEK
ncbi:MAG: OmpH family outer membrane protein [Phycisphaerae bacterium]|jgi:Skp family chaperone for outer membrane proteins|nr:OmpH family outer membrane protein [Phycisphaerae bacterium]